MNPSKRNWISTDSLDPFFFALLDRDRRLVADLLASDRSLVNKTIDGLSALLFAYQCSLNGQPEIVRELLDHGADINVTNGEGDTILHLAICVPHRYSTEERAGRLQLVQMLLDRGSNLSIRNNRGLTPFELACEEHLSADLVPLFLLNEAKFPSNQLHGISDDIPREFLYAFSAGDRAKLVDFLESDRSLANARLCHQPILTFAFRLHNEAIFEVLLTYGADANARDDRGRTLLDLFFYYDQDRNYAQKVPLVQLLLNHGGVLNIERDGNLNSPMHRAVIFREPALVQLLLDHHVDLNTANKFGETPLYLASGFLELTRVLLDHGAEPNPRHPSWKFPLHASADLKFIQLLLERGADANVIDSDGKALLHRAVEERSVELFQLLLNLDADVNVVTRVGDYQDTPLHLAAFHRDSAFTKLLLDHQPEVNARNGDGETPLHVACFYCRVENIGVLLRDGADVSVTNKYGCTPLHNAVVSPSLRDDRLESIMLLVERGADLTTENVGGITPLAFAREQGDLDIIYTLIRSSPQHLRPGPGTWNNEVQLSPNECISFAQCRNTEKRRSLPLIFPWQTKFV